MYKMTYNSLVYLKLYLRCKLYTVKYSKQNNSILIIHSDTHMYVCVHIYVYMHIYTHTHAHTFIIIQIISNRLLPECSFPCYLIFIITCQFCLFLNFMQIESYGMYSCLSLFSLNICEIHPYSCMYHQGFFFNCFGIIPLQ